MLRDAIVDVLTDTEPPPPNESNTCDRVIYPLLLAAGYSRREIVSRIADNSGSYPDYTILPDNEERTWFLEAKAWHEVLEDKHAEQSLNYANNNGKQWVILSNGRTWRLYDNHKHGTAQEKFVTEASLNDLAEMETFLNAISKESVIMVVCSSSLVRSISTSKFSGSLTTHGPKCSRRLRQCSTLFSSSGCPPLDSRKNRLVSC